MEKSPFLTEIAQDYNPHIEYVSFGDLTYLRSRPLGVAWQRQPERYAINIDRERLLCPHQVLFVLYHELGHIMQWHLGYRHYLVAGSYREEEADTWALKEMGLLDKHGHVKRENETCYRCFKTGSKICLKRR
jgi:hypothetical protein